MSTLNKQFVRLAVAIHAQLLSRRGREPLIELPIESWQRCSDLVRQIRRAQLRGWHLAANELLRDLRYTIPSIEHELTALLQKLPRPMETDRIATTGDIYQDLVALKEEFEGLDYDLRTCWLSVTTEPIVLDGIYLGPFEIQLQWDQLARSEAPTYRVIAKDPHPAESRENVTHPHVMDRSALRRRRPTRDSPGPGSRPAAGFLHARCRDPADLQPGIAVRGAGSVVRQHLLGLRRGNER